MPMNYIFRYKKGKELVTEFIPFFKSRLTKERFDQINAFFATLSDEQLSMIDDFTQDVVAGAEWELSYEYDSRTD